MYMVGHSHMIWWIFYWSAITFINCVIGVLLSDLCDPRTSGRICSFLSLVPTIYLSVSLGFPSGLCLLPQFIVPAITIACFVDLGAFWWFHLFQNRLVSRYFLGVFYNLSLILKSSFYPHVVLSRILMQYCSCQLLNTPEIK